jgi:uncharacterized protein (TIGR04255 family)
VCTTVCTVTEVRPPHLANAPLQVVAADLRFPAVPLSADDLKAVSQAVADDYPLPETQQGIGFQIGPEGVKQQATTQRHLFISLDRSHQVALTPGMLVLEAASRYEGFQTFAERWVKLTAAVAEVLAPRLQLRLGLRYVNQLASDEGMTLAAMRGRVNPSLLAPFDEDGFPYDVSSSLQELRLQGEDAKGTLRHGLQIAATSAAPGREETQHAFYVLDLDFYDDEPKPYDEKVQLDSLKLFNTRIWDIFRWSITDDEFQRMQPEERSVGH